MKEALSVDILSLDTLHKHLACICTALLLLITCLLLQDEIMVVKQTCSWRFLFFTGSFNLELEVIELVAGQELVFKLRESSFMKDFEGRWHVQRLVDNTCLVTHTLSVMPTMVPPEAFAEYTSKIFIRQVRDILQDLQQGVIRRVDGGALS